MMSKIFKKKFGAKIVGLLSLLGVFVFLGFFNTSCSHGASGSEGLGLGNLTDGVLKDSMIEQFQEGEIVESGTIIAPSIDGYYYGLDDGDGEVYFFDNGKFKTFPCSPPHFKNGPTWTNGAFNQKSTNQIGTYTPLTVKKGETIHITANVPLMPKSAIWNEKSMLFHYDEPYFKVDINALKVDVNKLKAENKWDKNENWPTCI